MHEILELEDGPSRLDLVPLCLWKATQVQSLGWEDPLEKGMATHSSVLAWSVPRGHRVGQDEVTSTFTFKLSKP